MTDSMPPFDDPSLKEAVRGCWGKVTAPATFGSALRGKLAASLVDSQPGQETGTQLVFGAAVRGKKLAASPFLAPRQLSWLPLAAAAAIVLAIGGIFWAVASNAGPSPLPGDWATALVARHDACSGLADHHFVIGVAPNDIAGARSRLANQLGFPVLSMSPDNGWKFQGAGPCPIAEGTTAHFLYRDGQITLSVFSVNAPALTSGTSALQSEVDGHQLAAFVRGNTLYCVVEYDPTESISPDAARSLLEQLESQFANPTPTGQGAVAATKNTQAADTTPIVLDAPADDQPAAQVASRDGR